MYRDPWVRKIQANYWFMVGEQRLGQGRKAGAIRAYERAGQVASDSRTMRFNVGVALLRCGELEQARAHALAAREIDPWRPGPYRLLARIAQRQGRLWEEEQLLKRAAVLEGFP
jgi:predicted Zn-dependent protease